MADSDAAVRYRHTQAGWAMAGTAVAILGVVAWQTTSRNPGPTLVVGAVLVLLLLVMPSLTVEVTDVEIRCRFGVIPYWKRLPLSRVASATPVRNNPLYGWGVRWTPHGWLWNISGLDAVELRYHDGGTFRIGTDEPDRLAAAIAERLPR
ncbi:MAG: hypothetical protein AB7O67_15440 [Vicinamibacterales bacterium]